MPASARPGASGITPGETFPPGRGFAISSGFAASALYAGTTLAVGWFGIAQASSSCRRQLTAFAPEPDQALPSAALTRSRTAWDALFNAVMIASNAR